jgi:hypothetical protein
MAAAQEQLSAIADILVQELEGQPFAILSNERYIVIVSDRYGVATVVGDIDAAGANKAALEIARQARLLGIGVQVHPFVVSDRPSGDGDMFVRPSAVALDIRSALAGRAGAKAAMSLDDATRLVDFLNGRQSRKAAREPAKMPPITPEFKRLLVATAERALGENKPWVAGVPINVEHVVAEDFMLAPLLLIAAENWTAPYLAAKRQGGFSFSVVKAETILGYRVSGLAMADPMITLVALGSVIRRHCSKGMCALDPCLLRFADLMGEIKGDANIFGEMDAVLVASQD